MKVIAVVDLPSEPLAAAGVFHQHWLPRAEAALNAGEDIMLIFSPASRIWFSRGRLMGLRRGSGEAGGIVP